MTHLDSPTFAPSTHGFPRWRGALLAVLGFAAAIGFLAQVSRAPALAQVAAQPAAVEACAAVAS